jgi:hypothetical protein
MKIDDTINHVNDSIKGKIIGIGSRIAISTSKIKKIIAIM